MAEQPSQPSRPPAPPDQPTAEQAAAVAAILAGLAAAGTGAAVAGAGVTTAAAIVALLRLLVGWGYDARVARIAIRVTIRTSLPGPWPQLTDRSAVAGNRRREPHYSAWFILNAARRIQERLDKGRSLEDATKPEKTYLEQRERARVAREKAAAAIDAAAKVPGGLEVDGRRALVWKAHTDDRVTWECRAADGRWFYADRPPIIGYPGMPHGGTCRCWPVQATPAALRGDTVDQAVRSAQGAADHPAAQYPPPAYVPASDERETA